MNSVRSVEKVSCKFLVTYKGFSAVLENSVVSNFDFLIAGGSESH